MSGSFSFEEASKPPAPVSFSFEEAATAPPKLPAWLGVYAGDPSSPQDAAAAPKLPGYLGAIAGNPSQPSAPTAGGSGAPMPVLDEYGRDVSQPMPGQDAANRIGAATAEGWRTGGFLTPKAEAEARAGNAQTWMGRNVFQPLVDLSNVPLRAMGALGAGTGQAAYEAGAAISPELGRDLYMLNQVVPALPMARPGGVAGPGLDEVRRTPSAQEGVAAIGAAPDVDGAIAAAGRAVSAPMAAVDADLLTPRAAPGEAGAGLEAGLARVAAAEMERPPAGAVAAPESVGAAASREGTPAAQIDLSTADMKANRRRAEMDDLLRPPQANDNKIYVEGSFPTLAERSADPLLSTYENLLRERNPGEFIGEGKRLTENNKARVNEYDKNTIPDPTLNTMRADRTARWNANADNILPTAQPADLTPALDWVQEQLDNPRIQENDAVRGVLEHFRERLLDDDGDLKTDPAAVWGIHDHLQNQLALAKDPLKMTGAEKFAEGQLLTAKRLVDDAMNAATDGRFQKALNDYAEDSKAINAGVLFNDFRPKLTNMSGEIQPANFHRFVVNLAKERGDPGIDPSMDISDQGMRSLINIDMDLKRAGLIRLGGPRGSPTNLLGALAESAGLDAAHKLLGSVPVVGKALSVGQQYLAQRKMIADTAKHLAPPEGGYIPPDAPEPPPTPIVPVAPTAPAAAVPPAAAPASIATAPELPPEVAAPAPTPITRDRAAVAAMRWLVTSPPEGTTLDLQAARRILIAAYGEPFVANLSRVKLSGLLANFAAQLRAAESGQIGTDLPAAAGRKQ